jgi:hypothetical protein
MHNKREGACAPITLTNPVKPEGLAFGLLLKGKVSSQSVKATKPMFSYGRPMPQGPEALRRKWRRGLIRYKLIHPFLHSANWHLPCAWPFSYHNYLIWGPEPSARVQTLTLTLLSLRSVSQ